MTTTKEVTTTKLWPEAKTKGPSAKPIVAESVGAGEIQCEWISVGAIIVFVFFVYNTLCSCKRMHWTHK